MAGEEYKDGFLEDPAPQGGGAFLPRERQRRRDRRHLERRQGRDQGRQDRPPVQRGPGQGRDPGRRRRRLGLGQGRLAQVPASGQRQRRIHRSWSPRASTSTRSRRSTAGSRSPGATAGPRWGRRTAPSRSGTRRASSRPGRRTASIRVSRFEGRIEADTTNGNIRLEGVAFKDGALGRDDQRLHHAGLRRSRDPQRRPPGQRDERPHHGGFPHHAPEPPASRSAGSRAGSARAGPRSPCTRPTARSTSRNRSLGNCPLTGLSRQGTVPRYGSRCDRPVFFSREHGLT